MPKETQETKAQKTAALVGGTNVLLTPIYYAADSYWGLAASAAISAALLYQCYEVGKKKRRAENMAHNLTSLFSPSTSSSIPVAFDNIIEGGADLFNGIAPAKPK